MLHMLGRSYSVNRRDKVLYITLATLSMTASFITVLTFVLSKKFRAHPAALIALISFCECFACYHFLVFTTDPIEFIETFSIDSILSYLTSFSSNSWKIGLCSTNMLLYAFFTYLSILLNFCICFDLIKTLRNPFRATRRRIVLYSVPCVVICLAIVGSAFNDVTSPCYDDQNSSSEAQTIESDDKFLGSQKLNIISATFTILFLVIGSFSIGFAIKRLYRGFTVNKTLRKFFLRKHILYVLTIILLMLWPITASIIEWLTESTTNDPILNRITKVTQISSGLILSIVRWSEPFFWNQLKIQIKRIFCCRKPQKDDDDGSKGSIMNTFINSSLNIELVHMILTGISQTNNNTKYTRINIGKKYKEEVQHTINRIKVTNPENWDVLLRQVNDKQDDDEPSSSLDSLLIMNDQQLHRRMSSIQQEDDAKYEKIKNDISSEPVIIVEHAPKVMKDIRHLDEIDDAMIKKSLNPIRNKEMVFQAGESQGKSGCFFFFTKDNKFCIKTMRSDELKTFKRFLKEYHRHLQKNPKSLIARVYGIYTIKIKYIVPVHIILMQVTITCEKEDIENVFDLKGSLANRITKDKASIKPSTVLKDRDLFRICREKIFLKFSETDIENISNILVKDLGLLGNAMLMDYSLLFAIERNPAAVQQSQPKNKKDSSTASEADSGERSSKSKDQSRIRATVTDQLAINKFEKTRNTFISANGKYIYHISIIDYLQYFNFSKSIESKVKLLVNKKSAEISAVHPIRYAKRFLAYMQRHVFINTDTMFKQK